VGRFEQDELLEAYEVYKKTRERIDAGELWWDQLRDHFTQDAVFVDPAWGRVDGIDNILKFLEDSMRGLEDWTFPLEWMAVDGDYLITGWQNRLPGRRPDGTYYQAPGMSRLRYAGDGRFDYEQDLINMVHMLEVMKESGWKPREGFQNPPRDRIRLCAWAP
jgi:ketosteroid isomerase-like protein